MPDHTIQRLQAFPAMAGVCGRTAKLTIAAAHAEAVSSGQTDLRERAMTYAQGRVYYDADSHIMELPDFLTEYADPAMRERLPKISYAPGRRSYGGLEEAVKRKAHTPEKVAELVALGDQMISGPKGYFALGASNPNERSTA